MARKDLVGKLADAGEEVIQRLAELPGGSKLVETFNGMRNRIDDLQRRIVGVEGLEQRVAELERRVEELSAAGAPARKPARRTSTPRRSAGVEPDTPGAKRAKAAVERSAEPDAGSDAGASG